MKKQYKIIILTAVFTLLLSSFGYSQNDIVPIMIMDNLPHTAILGGIKDSKFVSAKETVEALKTSQNFFMVDQEGVRKFNFDAKVKPAQSNTCSDYFETNVSADFETKGLGFGTNADWNPAPQKVAELFNFGVYKPLVAKFLREQGIRNPNVKISQIFYGDLDGDGRNEDVISGTNADSWVVNGNYPARRLFVCFGQKIGRWKRKDDFARRRFLSARFDEKSKSRILRYFRNS